MGDSCQFDFGDMVNVRYGSCVYYACYPFYLQLVNITGGRYFIPPINAFMPYAQCEVLAAQTVRRARAGDEGIARERTCNSRNCEAARVCERPAHPPPTPMRTVLLERLHDAVRVHPQHGELEVRDLGGPAVAVDRDDDRDHCDRLPHHRRRVHWARLLLQVRSFVVGVVRITLWLTVERRRLPSAHWCPTHPPTHHPRAPSRQTQKQEPVLLPVPVKPRAVGAGETSAAAI